MRNNKPRDRTHVPKRRSAASKAAAKAQRNGRQAEDLLQAAGNVYERRSEALLCKRYEPHRRIGKATKGVFKASMLGESGPDYSIWLPSGSAGFIELKSRMGGRIPLAAVGGLQATMLDRAARWGQLAFVIVKLDQEWYAIDWRMFTHEKKRSLNHADLEERGSKIEIEHNLPMFLPALIEARQKANNENNPSTRELRDIITRLYDGERPDDR